MNRKKMIILTIIFAGILLLAVFAKGEASSNLEGSDVMFDEITYVDNTTNLFTVLGFKVSNFLSKLIGYLFLIINKLLEFIFGI